MGETTVFHIGSVDHAYWLVVTTVTQESWNVFFSNRQNTYNFVFMYMYIWCSILSSKCAEYSARGYQVSAITIIRP
jgi:hypothetical protein